MKNLMNFFFLKIESGKGQSADDFWDFKVPQPPKPKMEVNRYDKWAESIEKLLGDPYGLDVFTKFLQGEISAENIHFYTRCLEFKETFPNLTQSQRISKASMIFQCYLQNGATEAINVDCQARNEVEKALSQPTREMFNLPLAQVFDLLKFDCYPRFLRSDMYRDYVSGVASLQESGGEPSDSDQDSVQSHKLHHDERRRSLLPWNKNRTKGSKHRNKNDPDALNADISFIQRAAGNPSFDGSDQEDGPRRQSCKLCRIHLPDNSATVFPCNPGETLNTAVQRLLENREFHYYSFEVMSVATGKALDLCMEVSEMISREIRVEPRAGVRIELPAGWIVGVRANPVRKLSEVLKPILNQHKLKLDAVVVYDGKSDKVIDVHDWTIGKVDGHSLYVKLKGDARLEEITNQIPSYDYHRKGGEVYMDDDQTSTKTSSSHASSLFGEFMRKSSKKFKRNKGQAHHSTDGDCQSQNSRTSEVVVQMHGSERETSAIANRATMAATTKISDEENCHPRRLTGRHHSVPTTAPMDSPLSLMRSEFNFAEGSRNRKPIYITQSQVEQNKS
jgi:regulator of G-protein signaling